MVVKNTHPLQAVVQQHARPTDSGTETGDHEHKENYVETNPIWLFNIAMENPL